MTKTRLPFLGLAIGFFAGALLLRAFPPVSAQGTVFYRVIDENHGGKIEEQLNQITRTNPRCKPVLAIAPSDYNKAKVILECAN